MLATVGAAPITSAGGSRQRDLGPLAAAIVSATIIFAWMFRYES
jgi:hypothetical protein